MHINLQEKQNLNECLIVSDLLLHFALLIFCCVNGEQNEHERRFVLYLYLYIFRYW